MNQKSKAQILADMAQVDVKAVEGDINLGAIWESLGAAVCYRGSNVITVDLKNGWTLCYSDEDGDEPEHYTLAHEELDEYLEIKQGDDVYAILKNRA